MDAANPIEDRRAPPPNSFLHPKIPTNAEATMEKMRNRLCMVPPAMEVVAKVEWKL